eukprot:gene65-93_t
MTRKRRLFSAWLKRLMREPGTRVAAGDEKESTFEARHEASSSLASSFVDEVAVRPATSSFAARGRKKKSKSGVVEKTTRSLKDLEDNLAMISFQLETMKSENVQLRTKVYGKNGENETSNTKKEACSKAGGFAEEHKQFDRGDLSSCQVKLETALTQLEITRTENERLNSRLKIGNDALLFLTKGQVGLDTCDMQPFPQPDGSV